MKVSKESYAFAKEIFEKTVDFMFCCEKQSAWGTVRDLENVLNGLKSWIKVDYEGGYKSFTKLVQEENNKIAMSDKPQSPTPYQRFIMSIIRKDLEGQGYTDVD